MKIKIRPAKQHKGLIGLMLALTFVLSPVVRAEMNWEKSTVSKEFRPTLNVLTKRAYAGNAKAQYALAKMYEEGAEGLPKNLAYALSWYEEAAHNGLKIAAKRLKHLAHHQAE